MGWDTVTTLQSHNSNAMRKIGEVNPIVQQKHEDIEC